MTSLESFADVLAACDEIERQGKIKLAFNHRLLMIERGTNEGLLTVLQGHPITVKVVEQGPAVRKTLLIDSATGETVMTAHTSIYHEHVPVDIRRDIDERKLGLGEILAKHKVETRRQMREVGFDEKRRLLYRTYDIYAYRSVWFTIREEFSPDWKVVTAAQTIAYRPGTFGLHVG